MAAHGIKKSHLIETAVLHHLNALDSIPSDLIIPPTIEVSRATERGATVFWDIIHESPISKEVSQPGRVRPLRDGFSTDFRRNPPSQRADMLDQADLVIFDQFGTRWKVTVRFEKWDHP